MSKYQQIDDTDCLKLWQDLNKEFTKIIDNEPPPAKVSAKLLELKGKVQAKNTLSTRQTESLTARIENYMAGTYGKSKTAENFGHDKPSK